MNTFDVGSFDVKKIKNSLKEKMKLKYKEVERLKTTLDNEMRLHSTNK